MIERIYNTRFQYNEDDESVKIAILDTGVDLKHEDLQQPRSKFSTGKFPNPITGEPKQIDRIKAYKNFCDDRDDDNDVDDIDGHGTYVAGIVLRLAPRAELLIARVCEGDKDYAGLTKNTEQDKRMKKQTAQKKIVDPRRVETVRKPVPSRCT